MKKRKKIRKHQPEKIQEFWQLLYDGYTYERIEEITGVSRWTLQDWRQCKTHYRLNNRMREQYGFEFRGAA